MMKKYRLYLLAAVVESGSGLSRFETWAHPGFTRAEGEDYAAHWDRAWGAGAAYYFAVTEAGGFVGSCGLSDISREHRVGGLFYLRLAGIEKYVVRERYHKTLLDQVDLRLARKLPFELAPHLLELSPFHLPELVQPVDLA